MFTNFKIEPKAAAANLAAMRAGFAASGKAGSFDDNAVRVIGERLRKHPECYVEFGPYWWAVKAALNAAGYNLGDRGDPLVAAEYRGATATETLVLAEAFKDVYRASYIAGTSTFDLTDEGDGYELADEDMQARVGMA